MENTTTLYLKKSEVAEKLSPLYAEPLLLARAVKLTAIDQRYVEASTTIKITEENPFVKMCHDIIPDFFFEELAKQMAILLACQTHSPARANRPLIIMDFYHAKFLYKPGFFTINVTVTGRFESGFNFHLVVTEKNSTPFTSWDFTLFWHQT